MKSKVIQKKIDFDSFPSTRYQGSKRKIVWWIYENLRKLEFETVLDACGGTGSVSYMFKLMNKSVTYNDNLAFNHKIGQALIENNSIKLLSEDIDFLLSQSPTKETFVQKHFNNIYFTEDENVWIDNIIGRISELNTYSPEVLQYKKSLAYYALFQSCLTKRPFNLFHRNNLYLRTNDIPRSFGNKTTWEKSFNEQFRKFSSEANNAVFKSSKNCKAMNSSIFQIDDKEFDLVYIDPPYVTSNKKNETSNYRRCYHFLEGLTMYDDWERNIDYNTKNLRLIENDNSLEFSPSEIRESMEQILDKFQKSTIVLSYKIGGVPSIKELKELMGKFKKRVYTRSMHYTYALNKQNGNAKKNREVLIIGI